MSKTPPLEQTISDEREVQKQRRPLSDHEAMAEAQAGCVPCKLCGGKAIISDAGEGAGYYIRCENSRSFRKSLGCMISERRLGGWAYNVMDWWNQLHAQPPAPLTALRAFVAAYKASNEPRSGAMYDAYLCGTIAVRAGEVP